MERFGKRFREKLSRAYGTGAAHYKSRERRIDDWIPARSGEPFDDCGYERVSAQRQSGPDVWLGGKERIWPNYCDRAERVHRRGQRVSSLVCTKIERRATCGCRVCRRGDFYRWQVETGPATERR